MLSGGLPLEWGLLGAFTGIQLLLVVLSVLIAIAYGERGLVVHAGAMLVGVLAVALERGPASDLVPAALLLQMALSALHVRELTSHVGSLRQLRRWMTGAAGALAVLAVAAAITRAALLLPVGVAVLFALDAAVVPRAWPLSRPWGQYVVAGQGALLLAGVWMSVPGLAGDTGLMLGGVLAFWSVALYLASVWRSRVFGERRWQQAAERLEDPLTGLSTPLVLGQRIQSARSLMRRYGHPSAVLLVHVEELARIAAELGAQKAEAAALEAGLRLRGALGPADVAARLGPHRFAILSEGSSPADAARDLATRLLAAGLRESLHAIEGAFLHYRVVLAELPVDDASVTGLLQLLSEQLDADVARGRDRRIRVFTPGGDFDASAPTEPVPL